MRWFTRLSVFSIIAAFLSACSSPPKEKGEACQRSSDCKPELICFNSKCEAAEQKPATKAPKAVINGALRVKAGQQTSLDGGSSLAYSGQRPEYTWNLVSKPDSSQAVLADPKASAAVFTPDLAGKYEVSLTVKDSNQTNEAKVTVEAFKDNVPPEAKLTPQDSTVKVAQAVELDASTSTDADKDTLSFKWNIRSRPEFSKAALSATSGPKVSLTSDEPGTYVVEVTVDDGKGGTALAVATITATKEIPAPTLTSITPSSGAKESVVDVVVDGENFVFGLKLTLGGKEIPGVDYVSGKKLNAKFDLKGIAAGKLKVKVENPDGKASSEVDFEVVEAQAPTITYVGPPLVIQGQSVRLSVEGTGFQRGAKVKFDTSDLVSEFSSDKLLYAALLVPADGTYNVVVTNPDGKASSPFSFRVSSVTPVLDSLSLATVGNDCPKEIIVVKGRNLLAGVKAELVDQADPTKKFPPKALTYVSMTELRLEYDFTQVPPSSYHVVLTNVGSTATATADFKVTLPVPNPELIVASPSAVFAEGKSIVYIVGLNIGGQFNVDGKTLAPKRLNSSTYALDIDASAITQPKSIVIEALGACGKKSDPQSIDILAIPTPKITTSNPLVIPVTGTVTTVTLTGEGFHPNAKVLLDGTAATGIVVKGTAEIDIPAALFTNAAIYKVVVENPGGRKSNEYSFDATKIPVPKITRTTPDALPLGTAPANIVITGEGFVATSKVLIDGVVEASAVYKSATSIELPSTLFATAKVYQIEVENAPGKKSNAYAFDANKKMVLSTRVFRDTLDYGYFCGENLRKESSEPAQTVRFYKNNALIEEADGYNSSDSGKEKCAEVDFYYSVALEFEDDQTYDVEVCRTVGGNTLCSNRQPFVNTGGPDPGGSGTTTGPTPFVTPTIDYLAASTGSSFILGATTPATLSFAITGAGFKTPLKVFIQGQDVAVAHPTATIEVAATSISIKNFPTPTLGATNRLDLAVEVEIDSVRSNTAFFVITKDPFARVYWAIEPLISNDRSTYYFSFLGQNLDPAFKIFSGGQPVKSTTGTVLTFSTTYSKAPQYLELASWNGAKGLTPGDAPVELEGATFKTNLVKFRIIEAGRWGTEPLAIRSITTSLSDTPGLAPLNGEKVPLQVGMTGFDLGGSFGTKGELLIGGQPATLNPFAASYTTFPYTTIAEVTVNGNPGDLIPIQFKNPDGRKSNLQFFTVASDDQPRLTKLSSSYNLSAVIRTAKTSVTFYGKNLTQTGLKVFFAGSLIPVKSFSTSTGYQYFSVDLSAAGLRDGSHPVWVESEGKVSNTLLVSVFKEGHGGAPRLTLLSPIIVNKAAATANGNKVRFVGTAFGLRSNDKLSIGGQKVPIKILEQHNLYLRTRPLSRTGEQVFFAEVDFSTIAAGNYPLSVGDDAGTAKSVELEIVVE